jgi:tricarballylate dehydrogenase
MKEKRKFDVIVVGGGNAALVAALSASESGAKVAVLEAANKAERGGNSRFAGAVFRIPHKGMAHIKELLCPEALYQTEKVTLGAYTEDEFTKDLLSVTSGKADLALNDVLLKNGYDTCKWMKDKCGVHWQLTLHKFFNEDRLKATRGKVEISPPVGLMAVHEGVGLTDDLWAATESRQNITIFYDTPGLDLIIDGNNVSGIRTRQADANVNFYGQVILGCGGFEANPRLRRQFLGEGWDLVLVRGTRFNTGTMLEKAIAAGAQSHGHWGGAHASPQDFDAPRVGDLRVTDKMSRYSYPYGISVNADGKRFMDEGEAHFGLTYAKTGWAISKQPIAKAFQVFDQRAKDLLEPRYSTGTPIVADTLEELGKKLELNVPSFLQTCREFNAACHPTNEFDPLRLDGNSTQGTLNPPKSNWAMPLDQAPFFAYKVTCGITFTYGGIKTDTQARALDNEGRVMPGLWVIGEMQGGLFYHNYPVGAGLVKGSVFGKIAGAAAAAKARDSVNNASTRSML